MAGGQFLLGHGHAGQDLVGRADDPGLVGRGARCDEHPGRFQSLSRAGGQKEVGPLDDDPGRGTARFVAKGAPVGVVYGVRAAAGRDEKVGHDGVVQAGPGLGSLDRVGGQDKGLRAGQAGRVKAGDGGFGGHQPAQLGRVKAGRIVGRAMAVANGQHLGPVAVAGKELDQGVAGHVPGRAAGQFDREGLSVGVDAGLAQEGVGEFQHAKTGDAVALVVDAALGL